MSALVSVDLPAFGRPTKHAKPARKSPTAPQPTGGGSADRQRCSSTSGPGLANPPDGRPEPDPAPRVGHAVPTTVPSGAARWTGASAARSRTAATPASSTVDASVTTAGASSRVAPAAAAAATAYCNAVRLSEGSVTLGPA